MDSEGEYKNMHNLKLFFSALTVAFAILGLTKALSYDITMPITFLCLNVTMFITSKENQIKGQKKSALYFLIFGIFLFVITAYNTVTTLV